MKNITTIFFDLDDTLYPASNGLWSEIKHRMNIYMHEKLNIPEDQIPTLREKFYSEYGTTLRGLQAHYPVDEREYLDFVHDLPLDRYLRPDDDQRALIRNLPQRKVIFTNADADHARRVLRALNLDDCFEQIIDVLAIAPYCKPQRESLSLALKIAGESDPARCAMIDDLPRTIKAAKDFGMFGIVFGSSHCPDADACITRWDELPTIFKL
jgi:pyrimidine 5'-nucleotidase